MGAVSTYSFGNLAWLGTQAVPLILWPSFISSLLRSEYETASSLENYFARSLGFALLALGLVVLVLSGALPLAASDGKSRHGCPAELGSSPLTCVPVASVEAISPYASAAFIVTTVYHATSAFYCYGRYTWTGETGYALGCIGSAMFATFGLYCVMFAGDKAMISKYHRFDQSTSGFPFKNAQSYRSKKKAL